MSWKPKPPSLTAADFSPLRVAFREHSTAAGTYVFSGEHLEQLLLRDGFCLDPWHLIANLSSSAISEHKL
jgi:hypothetical protein